MRTKFCPRCKHEKSLSEFYKSARRNDGLMSYCCRCFNDYVTEGRIRIKEKAIVYKGSKCVKCELSYPEQPSYIFDFHHVNPKEKEFAWNVISRRSWESQKKELDKCILVCAICHRHIEYGDSTETRTQN